ncbi:MAG: helix-turn-helix transcriptional regulator [Opitutales bacterium]|nr:helix-turn-helix transcriptional regulator [Opitutales bacterium]
MNYQTLTPAPALSAAVESIWIYSGYRPPHLLERVLPSGTVEMIVQLEGSPFRCYDPVSFALKQVMHGPLIVGARTEVQVIDTEQQLDVMGVHFKPGGIRSLFAMPANEFSGMDVPVDAVWNGFGEEIAVRLSQAPSPVRKLKEMERMLLSRLDAARQPHPAVPAALHRIEQAEVPISVGALAEDLGLSFRRFIEVFTSHVGLTPKSYSRIRRFQRALRIIHNRRQRSWADLAFDCGWCDQAHMIRDFKTFSGLTPREYESLNVEFMLHVPVEERGQICPIPHAQSMVGLPR